MPTQPAQCARTNAGRGGESATADRAGERERRTHRGAHRRGQRRHVRPARTSRCSRNQHSAHAPTRVGAESQSQPTGRESASAARTEGHIEGDSVGTCALRARRDAHATSTMRTHQRGSGRRVSHSRHAGRRAWRTQLREGQSRDRVGTCEAPGALRLVLDKDRVVIARSKNVLHFPREAFTASCRLNDEAGDHYDPHFLGVHVEELACEQATAPWVSACERGKIDPSKITTRKARQVLPSSPPLFCSPIPSPAYHKPADALDALDPTCVAHGGEAFAQDVCGRRNGSAI